MCVIFYFFLPVTTNFNSGVKYQSVLSLPDQLKMFKEYTGKLKGIAGEEGTSFILTNSLFLLVAGSDDLANTYFTVGIRRVQYDVASYTDLMVASATDFVQVIFFLRSQLKLIVIAFNFNLVLSRYVNYFAGTI